MVNEGASESPPPNRDDASAASPERAALAATVNEEEARLRRLEAEHADAMARVDALRAKLAALDQAPKDHAESLGPVTTAPRRG